MTLTPELKARLERENDPDYYKNEGMAIYVKGVLVHGIGPRTLEEHLDYLSDGSFVIDWEAIKKDYLK